MTATTSTPLRKSKRQRAPNKKYTDDPFEGLDILSSDSEDGSGKLGLQNEAKSDDDFPANRPVQGLEAEASDDSVGSDVSDGSAVLTPKEIDEDARSYASSDAENELGTRPMPRSKAKGSHRLQAKAPKKLRRIDLFGGTREEDVSHILMSRDQWANDPTLPSKNRMCYPFSHTEEMRHMEATIGWDWYYDQGGRYSFAEKQKTRALSVNQGSLYVPGCTRSGHSFLMGPYGRQKLFTLSALHTSGLEEAWTDATHDGGSATQPGSRKRKRHGWMMNVGTRVKCLDWAPNHEGDAQYLALATGQPKRPPTDPAGEAPAFTPTIATPSCIQIWAFSTSTAAHSETSLDSDRSPVLKQVLCSDWGDVKQLKWCPMPRSGRDEGDRGKVSIGLLAGVWSDGCVRVLDIQTDKAEERPTAYGMPHGFLVLDNRNTKNTCGSKTRQCSIYDKPIEHDLHVSGLALTNRPRSRPLERLSRHLRHLPSNPPPNSCKTPPQIQHHVHIHATPSSHLHPPKRTPRQPIHP